MVTLTDYLNEYKESHQNPVNVRLHFICVPLIMWSLLGFLHEFKLVGDIHFSHIFACLGILFYVYLDHWRVTLTMMVTLGLMLATLNFIPYLISISIVVFVCAWLGQFYGHAVEGKKPSFFKDLIFLLIGPVWILKKIAPKFVY